MATSPNDMTLILETVQIMMALEKKLENLSHLAQKHDINAQIKLKKYQEEFERNCMLIAFHASLRTKDLRGKPMNQQFQAYIERGKNYYLQKKERHFS